LKTSSALSKYYSGHARPGKSVLQTLIDSYVSSLENLKHKITYNLNTVHKSNRQIVERGNVDTSIYMIAYCLHVNKKWRC